MPAGRETFFESRWGPLLDSWVIGTVKPEGFYGHVRFLGSLSYAVVVVVFGVVISKFGTNIIFITFAFGAALNVYIASRIKTDTPVAALKLKDLKIGRLLSNYHYVTFLVFSTVLYIPVKTIFIFLPAIIDSVSGNSSHIGIYTTIAALSEIPVFLFGSRFMGKHKPVKLILLAAAAHIARIAVFPLASSPFHMILIALFRPVRRDVFIRNGILHRFDNPIELRSTSLTLANSIYRVSAV